MKIRQYIILFFFFATCFALSLVSRFGHFDDFGKGQEIPQNKPGHDQLDESYFKDVTYFSVQNSKPILQLDSVELSVSSSDGVVIGFNPKGIIYRYDKNNNPLNPIYFQSKNSRALMNKKEVYLDNEVELKMDNTNLHADKVTILSNGEFLYAYNNVKTISNIEKTNDQILVDSTNAVYRPKEQFFEYKENVSGVIKRKREYEESIYFKTDLMTVNGPKLLAEMKGNVSIKKESLDAYANRGEVFLENYNKRLKYYALYDDVRLQEKLMQNGRLLIRKAFSEKLEGLMSDRKIILTGLPKVFQGNDVIKGNRIIIKENVETVEVDDANSNITLEKEKK